MKKDLSPSEQALLSHYVSNLDRPVFALRNLPEEVVAVLFAYYSRSNDTLRRNLLKLIADQDLGILSPSPSPINDSLSSARDKASLFHEKWVVGYGHASVAEHAVAHIAVEDISILASKVLEDARLASFTEKSTRYVEFEKNHYLRPNAIMASKHAQHYVDTADALFEAYTSLTHPLKERLKELFPPSQNKSPRAYERAIKAKACDILRYLLPSATLTNLGMTINGRALSALTSKMLSHPLEEARTIGESLCREGRTSLPTLMKYTERSEYRAQTPSALEAVSDALLAQHDPQPTSAVSLVRYNPNAEVELTAAIIYPHSRLSLAQLRQAVETFSASQRAQILHEALRRRGRYDNPLRELEHISYTFDMLIDFGAFRDIQRHRIVSQSSQALTIDHGYEVPEELELLNMSDIFEEHLDRAADCYLKIKGSHYFEAAYILPMAFRRRVLFTLNLRELVHFIELRSAPQGHRSYRRVAQEMYRQVAKIHPFIAQYIRVTLEGGELGRLEAEERAIRNTKEAG